MGMTIIEKILARHAVPHPLGEVQPGEIVPVRVDRAVRLDIDYTDPTIRSYPPTAVWDPDRICMVLDHYMPPPSIQMAEAAQLARSEAKRLGIRLFDAGRGGISHAVVQEHGWARPGEILTNPDSHACSSGAFNCAARGMGFLESLYICCTGQTWFQVGGTIRFVLLGELPAHLSSKDVFLTIAGDYGAIANRNAEFVGPGVGKLSMGLRIALATMGAELSAEFTVFEADEVTREYLRTRSDAVFEPVTSDGDAVFEDVVELDLSRLEPKIARPDTIPRNVSPVGELEGTRVTQAVIGSCSDARIEHLRHAAQVLRGRKVHEDVRLLITPSSQQVYRQALEEGLIHVFTDAGAMVTNATCGACMGTHMGVLSASDVCITSTTRNFKGRMGHTDAKIYIGSSATVAASAVQGCITDPRRFLT
jgi:3-isopropylmalate/(R)-2-methylmalate dehydratase large subunit